MFEIIRKMDHKNISISFFLADMGVQDTRHIAIKAYYVLQEY